jgi:hypothetical protein
MFQRCWEKGERPQKYMTAFVHFFTNLQISYYSEEADFWRKYAKKCDQAEKRLSRMSKDEIEKDDKRQWENQ